MSKDLGPNDLPYATVGERILVLAHPPKSRTIGGLDIPEQSQLRPFEGTILGAGLTALDKMHDHGVKVGDRILFGKFAGVMEEWDHLEKLGEGPCEEHSWSRLAKEANMADRYSCDRCKAIRKVEPITIVMVDDILANIELGERLRSGVATYRRGTIGENGPTQHYVERNE